MYGTPIIIGRNDTLRELSSAIEKYARAAEMCYHVSDGTPPHILKHGNEVLSHPRPISKIELKKITDGINAAWAPARTTIMKAQIIEIERLVTELKQQQADE